MGKSRLEILKNSLAKKEKQFSEKLQNHIDTVKQANGQPLNDKRNGSATLKKWDRQNEHLIKLKDSIQKTKDAIEREEGKISDLQGANEILPNAIKKMVKNGDLNQWRKHPTTFFVPGVDKGRIVWDNKKKVVVNRHYGSIPTPEQKVKFAKVYNKLYAEITGNTQKKSSNTRAKKSKDKNPKKCTMESRGGKCLVYEKAHTNDKALKNHIQAIKKRGGTIVSETYSYPKTILKYHF